MIRTKRGLDLPISGSPSETIEDSRPSRTVALVGYDYPGLKPTMEVAIGDKVKAGDLLFTDKKSPGVRYTSPAAGTVAAINRGAKRVFQSLVIDVEGEDAVAFTAHGESGIAELTAETVREQLIESGLWTTLRTRPYAKVPAVDAEASAIFVTAMDTRPLACDPMLLVGEHQDAFKAGLDVLARLTTGNVFVCSAPGADVPRGSADSIRYEEFSGPHPAGLVGTHIHFLHPVSAGRSVFSITAADVVGVGYLFLEGRLFTDRIISLAGPLVENPRLIRTRVGASTDELTAGEIRPDGEPRIISGSVLDGRKAASGTAFLGRLHNQVSVLKEGTERELLEFVMPNPHKFSKTRLYIGSWIPGKKFDMTTSREGSDRSMIPLGSFEEIMPLDILPVQLLRALLVDDFDSSVELGCLELDEDDVALSTYVCPGKYEYGPYLRRMLDRVEAES